MQMRFLTRLCKWDFWLEYANEIFDQNMQIQFWTRICKWDFWLEYANEIFGGFKIWHCTLDPKVGSLNTLIATTKTWFCVFIALIS